MHRKLRKLGILCGILGPLLWLSLIAMSVALRPEFNDITQYISELGERGSSTEWLMRYAAFGLSGFLYLCFALALLTTFRGGWPSAIAAVLIALDGVGRIGAGVFACDPGCSGTSSSQELHGLFATIGFVSGILAAVAWGIIFRLRGWLQDLTWYSIGSGVLAIIFLVLMSWKQNPVIAVPGLFELLATGVLSLWILAFATRLLKGPGSEHG